MPPTLNSLFDAQFYLQHEDAIFAARVCRLRGKIMMELKKRLARLLVEKSYREGNFTLASGRKSDYYFDCRGHPHCTPKARVDWHLV